MWHEARKQERKIRGMIVDYRKRAERRQDFYERIKSDPAQFLQIYGRQCKIHLDPAIAAAGDGASIIVPWQGHTDNLIDRFDVRAHLDHIDPISQRDEWSNLSNEERHCNYERYRILAQNEFLGITEEKFLHQLHLDEKFGANAHSDFDKDNSKKKPSSGAAINFSYDDAASSYKSVQPTQTLEGQNVETDSDLDMDVSVDISKLDTYQAHEINACGRNFGMLSNDFYSYLTKDADEADALRMAREEEREKLVLSGRKSRRERRAQREKRLCSRPLSPPSYAAKEDKNEADCSKAEQESDSRSTSPETSEKITFITSFGGEDELRPHSKISIKLNKRNVENKSSSDTKVTYNKHLSTRVSYRTDERSSRNRRHNTQKTEATRKHSKTRSRSNSPIDHRFRKSPHKYQSERSVSSCSGEVAKDSRCAKSIVSQKQSSVTSSERNHLVAGKSEKESVDANIVTPVKRYYGRKREDCYSDADTDSESSAIESTNSTHSMKTGDQDITTSEHSGKIPSSVKCQDAAGKSLRERLKRKMQLLLNKQYKADKRAEIERNERQMQQQQERQDEMRDLALKLRRRQRELRHKYGTSNRSSYSSSSSSSEERLHTVKKERSKSPEEQHSRRNRSDHSYMQSQLGSHGSLASRGKHNYASSNMKSFQDDKPQTDYQREHSRHVKSHKRVHTIEDRDYEHGEFRNYSKKDETKEKLHSRIRDRRLESSASRIVDY